MNFNVNKKRTFRVYLHSYVHLSIKSGHAVLYNTLNGRFLEYNQQTAPLAIRLLKRIDAEPNPYTATIEETSMHGQIKEFIGAVRDTFMGDIVDTAVRPHPPIQFKPILNLQTDKEFSTTDSNEKLKQLIQDELTDYLNVLTLYINDECGQNCPMCTDAHKQFLCCTKSNVAKKRNLAMIDIEQLCREVDGSRLYRFNILGGNLFAYPELTELALFLNWYEALKEYYTHYLNINHLNEEFQNRFFEILTVGKNRLNVLVHFPPDKNALESVIKILNRYSFHKKYCFIIWDERHIAVAEEAVTAFGITDYTFIPYNNGSNREFFKKNVYLSRKDIIEAKPDLKELLARTCLNTYDFKKLTVKSDKKIYANINNPMLGKLGKDPIFGLIYKEINKGRSWTKVRKHVAPCKSCAFNVLCPPISNYERVEGKYNLCTIREVL